MSSYSRTTMYSVLYFTRIFPAFLGLSVFSQDGQKKIAYSIHELQIFPWSIKANFFVVSNFLQESSSHFYVLCKSWTGLAVGLLINVSLVMEFLKWREKLLDFRPEINNSKENNVLKNWQVSDLQGQFSMPRNIWIFPKIFFFK